MAGINPTPVSRMELTPWDLQLFLVDPIQKGFLLHNPPSKHTLIDLLKTSLSRTLDFFPPLAGRLSAAANDDGTATFSVDCNNAGVEFTHAGAAAVSLSDILEPKYKPEMIFTFFPLNQMLNLEGVSKPLWTVQVTELADGIFIGCTANHAVIDGTSFWDFLNSWSEIARGLDSISKPPIFEKWFPSSLSHEIGVPPLDPQKVYGGEFVQPPFLERVLQFSRESLAKLKAKANSEARTDKITTLQALSAHLWRSYMSVMSREREAGLAMVIGSRARIPLPEGYFGNGVCVARTAMSAAELLQEGLGNAAVKISELVSQQSRDTFVKFMEDWAANPTFFRKGSFGFAITSSPWHNVYGIDFGWGKPIAVRSGKAHKFDGKITLFPAAKAGGIDVEVCFAPETWRAMGDCEERLEPLTP